MKIFQLLFGKPPGDPASRPESPAEPCERLEQRRTSALRAYSEEHLFGYVDHDGNLTLTPPERRSREA